MWQRVSRIKRLIIEPFVPISSFPTIALGTAKESSTGNDKFDIEKVDFTQLAG
jgi:hypothetical protein